MKRRNRYNTIDKSDFTFDLQKQGIYKVTYTSPITLKSWSKTITDMTIIDLTKNEEYPKIKDLTTLKKLVK